MGTGKQRYRVVIAGGGRQGMALLEPLVPPKKEGQLLEVVGVLDIDPQAPGLAYARRHHLFFSSHFPDLRNIPDIDIIFNATGDPQVSQQLKDLFADGVTVLDCHRPYPWKDFWDLLSMGITLPETKPALKIGIVGVGKGGSEVLRLLTSDLRRRGRLQVVGVAEVNPQAPGLKLAREEDIPIFTDHMELIRQEPDVILELTGEGAVQKELKRHAGEQTQIIDHQKTRVLWALLQQDEDRFRTRIESELKLASQRSRFQSIFDHLPDPVLVLNADRTVELVNRTFLQAFHKTEEEVVGQPCYQIFQPYNGPCDLSGVACPLPEVLADGVTRQVVHRIEGTDGEPYFFEITMSPLFPPEAPGHRVIEVIKDISSRKRLEEALQSSEEYARQLLKQAVKGKNFLETIVNGIQDHMMVIDLDYRIIEVNRALLETVGRRREEVVGRHCYEVSHHSTEPCTIPDHPCPLKDAVATAKAASATHVHFDKDGREHYFHVECHPLFDDNGTVTHVVDLSRDITKELSAHTRMLHEDKMASLGKLSASVVHEINNPLTGILNFIKLMQRTLKDHEPSAEELEKIKTYLEIVYGETSRVSKTVSNLLTFSRKTKPEFKPVILNMVVEETLSLTDYQMKVQGIKVQRQFAEDLLPVMADPMQLKQAFLNLIINAQDAMPQGGALSVRTRNRGKKQVVITFTDTGVGIPKEYFSQIFEPFYTTKKSGAGVGLGLSVVYGIIQEHKGNVKVDSELGRGTSFTISLPSWRAVEDADSP